MIMHWKKATFALAILVAGCAGTRQSIESVTYDSKVTPEAFDLIVVRKSSTRYEIDGSPYTFNSLVEHVKSEKARTVLVEGTSSVADVLCVSILGVETGSAVFFNGSDGKAKAVSFSMDTASTAGVARSCRE
jgi:hypothetical protein